MKDDERYGWILGLWIISVLNASMLFLAIGAGWRAGGEHGGPQDGSGLLLSLIFTAPFVIIWLFRVTYLAGRKSR